MNLIANRRNLREYGRVLLKHTPEEHYKQNLKLLIEWCTAPCTPRLATDRLEWIMEWINKLLQTCGVESVYEMRTGESVSDSLRVDPADVIDIRYCNTGDSYGMTILYWKGRFRIGDWASIVEKLSKSKDV